MRILEHIGRDFRNRENIDLYATVLVAIAALVVVLTVPMPANLIAGLGLLVLVLLAFALLRGRHHTLTLIENQNRSEFIFSERSPVTPERLRRAKSISHNGISLVATSSRLLGVLSDRAGEGATIRLLVVADDDIATDVVARRFAKHQDPARLKREIRFALDNFSNIIDRDLDNFKVRALKAVPPFSLWILDEGTTDEEIWLGLYPFRDEPEPWIHILPHADRYLFEFLVRQFHQMWGAARFLTPDAIPEVKVPTDDDVPATRPTVTQTTKLEPGSLRPRQADFPTYRR